MICIAGKNKIAVFGLKTILEMGISKDKIIAVINKNDAGKHEWQPSFKKYCIDQNIRIVDIEETYKYNDLIFISLEFDQIVKTDRFKSKNLYNIHFSLLPAYKGMYTSILPILNGESYSGVTLHKIDNGIDTGEIIDQCKFNLNFKTTGLELYENYLKYSKSLFLKNIDNILTSKITTTKQPIINASYFSKKSIDFTSISINFNTTCYQACNYVNAFSFRPYQLVGFNGNYISRALPSENRSIKQPGLIIKEDSYSFEVTTIDYNIILLKDSLAEILEAARKNELNELIAYHKKGFSFKEKNQNGWDTLIVACYNNSFEVVKYLTENKLCNINTTNNNGTSALMYAMTNASKIDDLKLLSYLLDKGPRLNHVDYTEKNVFYYAEKYNNKKVIKLLSNYL